MSKGIVITGYLHIAFAGKHVKLTRGWRYRSQSVQLPRRFMDLSGQRIRITVEKA